MNKKTKKSNRHFVDLEMLRLQLKDNGKVYWDSQNSEEPRERLLHTLQTNNCRKVIAAVVDGDVLATAVVRAGYRGHVDILEAFLEHGMNVDIKDEYGNTALICGSSSGQEGCIQSLFDRNASVNVQNKSGMTALMWASHLGDAKIVQMLLEKNANPDYQSNTGTTALMFASRRTSRDIVQLLLNSNADVELKNDDGKTALDLATKIEIKEMLLNHVTSSYVLK